MDERLVHHVVEVVRLGYTWFRLGSGLRYDQWSRPHTFPTVRKNQLLIIYRYYLVHIK
jgi:hypothetical protein